MDEEKYAAMISSSPIETVLIEYGLEDRPVAVVMVDIQRDGLSAVYSFFDPDLKCTHWVLIWCSIVPPSPMKWGWLMFISAISSVIVPR